MALEISGATYGYDVSGIKAYIEDLKTSVIEETIQIANDKVNQLQTTISDAWVGKSAEVFYDNMKEDLETLTDALKSAGEAISDQIDSIAGTMSESEETLVNKRS